MSLIRKLLQAVAVLCLLLLMAAPSKAEVKYTITPLGNFTPMGMNSLGDVVGMNYNFSEERFHAMVVYHDSYGIINNIGDLGGLNSQALGINDNGDIVGSSETPGNLEDPHGPYHAFLYSKGVMSDLGTMGYLSSQANGINNSGQIVGSCTDGNGLQHAFLRSGETMTDISPPNVISSGANAINISGEIIGGYFKSDKSIHVAVFRDGGAIDLGNLGGNQITVSAINSIGQIVGYAEAKDGRLHAFLYEKDQMTDLGISGEFSEALGINDSGQIVGYRDNLGAFLYSNGNMTSLNTMIDSNLGITLKGADRINNYGLILAEDVNGEIYLLTPIPEPSSLALLECPLIVLCYWAYNRRKRYCPKAK
jgi:probable HAF family extracellular repeat protein